MAYLGTIVKDIEKHYGIKIHGNVNSKRTIDGIRFLDDKDISISYLYPNILYLADYREKYSKDLVGDILYVASEQIKPSDKHLSISEEIDLYDLHNTIESSLQFYRQIESGKTALFNALYTGKGLKGILDTAYKLIHNPIVVCDSSYNVLESFPLSADNRFFETRNNRISLKDVFSDDMKKSQIIDRIYHSVYPFVQKIENADCDMIFESIRIKRAVVGYICIQCVNKIYDEKDLEIIHSLTQMVSIQLQKDDTYDNPQGIKYDMFLKELFDKQFESEDVAKKHLRLMGVEPRRYYYIIVSGFVNTKHQTMATTYYWQQLTSIFRNSITGVFGNRFTTLVSTSNKEHFFEKLHSRLEAFLTMNQMLCAVSYSYDKLMDSSIYTEQSNSLLSDRMVTYNESSILLYEDHYLKHITGITKQTSVAEATIHPSIKDMIKCDKKEGTEYINTLKTYFACNRSMPATAKALFIHKSTLFYRFDKMKQLFDIDIKNPDKLFIYEYSLRIADIILEKK